MSHFPKLRALRTFHWQGALKLQATGLDLPQNFHSQTSEAKLTSWEWQMVPHDHGHATEVVE